MDRVVPITVERMGRQMDTGQLRGGQLDDFNPSRPMMAIVDWYSSGVAPLAAQPGYNAYSSGMGASRTTTARFTDIRPEAIGDPAIALIPAPEHCLASVPCIKFGVYEPVA